jgi:MHS family proline/betaine transporter-like MFS transporter
MDMAHTGETADSVSRRSMTIAALSTVVEWYDFTLYLYMATILSRVFFGGGAGSLAATLAAFAIAYLMRPVGALVFGAVGDRLGRRSAMLLSMGVMTVAMLATALLPTAAQIGPVAGWALLALRCIMSFSVGGEYTAVVAYLLESAPDHRRGLITSFAAAASEIGALLAAGVSALTVALWTSTELDAWGWRIPFLVGAVLAAGIWIARAWMEESPDFERQRARGTVPTNPLRHALGRHRPAIARGFAISALGSITYYVGITYVPAFLSSTGWASEGGSLWLSTIAAAVVILVTPVTGLLSDHFGRRPVLVLLASCSIVLPITMFALMADGTPAWALVGAVVLAGVGGGMSAVGAVATAEQFPGEGRMTGLALGATTATAIFGGLAPLVAQLLIDWTGWLLAPGAMIAIVALCVLPVLITLPESRLPVAGRR